jgi:hypothetical protein
MVLLVLTAAFSGGGLQALLVTAERTRLCRVMPSPSVPMGLHALFPGRRVRLTTGGLSVMPPDRWRGTCCCRTITPRAVYVPASWGFSARRAIARNCPTPYVASTRPSGRVTNPKARGQ